MAHHRSAKKRARQAVKRRDRKRPQQTRVRRAVKAARGAVEEGDPELAMAAVRAAERQLRRAASKGVIPKSRASRLVSRLARSANPLSR